MTLKSPSERGNWTSKLGFVLAAAGSAVGLGNIWAFPNQVAQNGGAAFLFVYILCCFVVGFPVMVAELSIGRRTRKDPVGAFRELSGGSRLMPLIGFWGVLCGVMILAFYNVVAGWTLGYVFEEIFHFLGSDRLTGLLADLSNGHKNAFFSVLFMSATVGIVVGGVSGGIERATKTMMPTLIGILLVMIGYVLTLPGSSEGLTVYLRPDFSRIDTQLVFSAMGQAFFSLSLGMGAMITYGSYLGRDQNLPAAAAYVTLADLSIAFLAGFLIMPAMFVAQNQGIEILDAQGALVSSTGLVFNVLPHLFHTLGTVLGVLAGVLFFLLLGIAALTSTISLLEVPVSYFIDEHGVSRRRAAVGIGLAIGLLSLVISYKTSLIAVLLNIFNNIGLPLGGLMICLFLGYCWKTERALREMRDGYSGVDDGLFSRMWPFFIRFICPVLIAIVLVTSALPVLGPLLGALF
ncbi:MAG: sodium-dependent transporter [Acidobacteriota bacterium]